MTGVEKKGRGLSRGERETSTLGGEEKKGKNGLVLMALWEEGNRE